jgi:hypothetical protein
METYLNLIKTGGPWLGAVRSWIQSNCINGDSVTWNSSDVLQLRRSLTVAVVEEIAAIAVAADRNKEN